MNIKERFDNYFRGKSPFRITTDILFYIFILALILPFSRKHVMTGMNRIIMMRPAVMPESRQTLLEDSDYRWMLTDLEGNPVSFSSMKERTVFLSFWATWCPPCRAELPNIQRLYEKYGDRMSMIMASSEDPAVLKAFLESNDYSFPVYRYTSRPPGVFRSPSIPTTFLITHEGKISVKKTGSARWDGKYFTGYLEGLLEKDQAALR